MAIRTPYTYDSAKKRVEERLKYTLYRLYVSFIFLKKEKLNNRVRIEKWDWDADNASRDNSFCLPLEREGNNASGE